MKNNFYLKVLILSVAVCHPFFSGEIKGQTGGTFQITQSVIAAGGGSAAGGQFSMNGTIGQSVAGTNSVGGTLRLQSGFWADSDSASARVPFDFDGDGKT